MINDAVMFLQKIVGLTIRYMLKSGNTELYDFGFGHEIEHTDILGNKRKVCSYILHILCEFRVVWKNKSYEYSVFDGNSEKDNFEEKAKELIGKRIKNVEITEKNNLYIDLGDCYILLLTYENGEGAHGLI